MANTRSGLPPASSFVPDNPPPPEEHHIPQEESSEMPAPPQAVVFVGAFEELRQQVIALTQLLNQRNSHPSHTPTPEGGFMADAQTRVHHAAHDDGGVGTSGVPQVASGSRSVTIDSAELARIIQEGIAAGIQQNTRAATGFTPNTPFTPDAVMCKAFP